MEPERSTKLGTTLSQKWDDEWVAENGSVEKQLNRRICGAHSPAWTPCKLGSDHPNGRRRYHGSHSLIGAPLGNRNAMIHGLYSRRLQQCGDHCPLWQTCPMPNKDTEALPHKERPYCPYENEEYDAITSSSGQEKETEEKAIASRGAAAEFETSPLIPLQRGTIVPRRSPEAPLQKGDYRPLSIARSPPLKGDQGGCCASFFV